MKTKAVTITLPVEDFAEFERIRLAFSPPMKRSEFVRWLIRNARAGFQMRAS